MEATIPGASVEAGDCTQLSRRRNLLQSSEASLDFTVTVTGEAALVATADSISAVISAAVSSGDFATALAANAVLAGVTTLDSVTVSGVAVVFAPTPAPTPAPTASPVIAPTATAVIESGSWRLVPAMGLLGTCIAVLATAWV